MKKVAVILVVIFVILAGVIAAVNLKGRAVPVNTKKPAASNTAALPFTINNPNVANATVFYTFVSTVKDFSGDNLILNSKVAAEQLPVLPISKDTQVFRFDGKESKAGSIADVKTGTNLLVTASYDFSKLKWNVTRLTINDVISTAPGATSTPVQK